MKREAEVVVFDVDGVLVDVHGSFHRTVLETVRSFTGRRVRYVEIQRWKDRPGFNDDWTLSTAWVNELGCPAAYEDVKKRFEEIYWGRDGDGLVNEERWLVPQRVLAKWARERELAIFTGRTKRELGWTLERFRMNEFFRRIVTVEDVSRGKPHPEGLLKAMGGRDPASGVYLGDNIDDALAARAAGVPFLAVLPRGSEARRRRAAGLRANGALAILNHVKDAERHWR